MDFENKAPKWDATGAEPSADLQKNGFMAGYKPPAAYFNYLFNAYTKCVNELQALLKAHEENTENIHDVTAEQVGALSSKGGTLDGNLKVVTKNYPQINLNNTGNGSDVELLNGTHNAQLISRNVIDNLSEQRSLLVGNSNEYDLKAALQLYDKVNGIVKEYKLFGEHNPPTAAQVGALSEKGGNVSGNVDVQTAAYPLAKFTNTKTENQAQVMAGNHNAQLTARNVKDIDSNERAIVVHDSTGAAEVKNAVVLTDKSNGTFSSYNLYGEHNKGNMPFLPLTGGTIADNLFFNGGFGRIVASSDLAQLEALRVNGDLTNRRMFRVYSGSNYNHANAFRVLTIEGNASSQSILFGEHNKPTATYTGNGTGGTRQIRHDGIGHFAVVQSDKGTVFATPLGGLLIPTSGALSWLTNANLIYQNGVLTVNTTNALLNASGTTYKLYCI